MRVFKRTLTVLLAIMMTAVFFTNTMPAAAISLFSQTLTAALFTDASYSEEFVTDTQITVSGMMPAHASVKGYPVSYSIDGTDTIAAYDLTVFEEDGVTVYEPDDQALTVTFLIPELTEADSEALSVYHVADDGAEEEIAEISAECGSISFEAMHFSVYVIIRHEGEEAEVNRVEFHFLSDVFEKVEDPNESEKYNAAPFKFRNTSEHSYYHETAGGNSGQLLQSSQIVLNGETLETIENPPNHYNEQDNLESYFYGWYVVTPKAVTQDPDTDEITNVQYVWSTDPEEIVFDEPVTIVNTDAERSWTINGVSHPFEAADVDDDGCLHVYLAPLYSDYHFINFHLYSKDILDPQSPSAGSTPDTLVHRKLIAFGSNYEKDLRIGNTTAPSPDARHLVFVGWERYVEGQGWVQDITVDSSGSERPSLDENNQPRDGYYITCNYNEVEDEAGKNIDLYPVFVRARWVKFVSNQKGASYNPEKFLLTSDLAVDQETLAAQGLPFELTELGVSSRNGYRFLGWFDKEQDDPDAVQITDANGNVLQNLTLDRTGDGDPDKYKIENGKLTVYNTDAADPDLSLYAHWQVIEDTEVTVIVWKQKVTDDVNTPASERTYDYETGVKVRAKSGKTLQETLNDSSLNVNRYTQSTYAGFHLDRTFDSEHPENDRIQMSTSTVQSDGSTVINIYYDRNVHELKFYDVWYNFTQTTSDDGVQYMRVGNTSYYEVLKRESLPDTYQHLVESYQQNSSTSALWGIVDGQYVQLVRNNSNYYYYYEVDPSDNSGTQYRLNGNNYSQIYYRNNQWYTSRNGNTTHTGTRYKRNTYSGERYQLTSAWVDYSGEVTEENGTYYGTVNGETVELRAVHHYTWTHNGEPYTGTRYTATRSNKRDGDNNGTWTNLLVYTIRALYGQNIANHFPINGAETNGRIYNTGERWNPRNSSTFNQVLVFLESMPDEDIEFNVNYSSASTKSMTFYIETLEGETPDIVEDGIPFKTLTEEPIAANYNFFTEAEDWIDITGFKKYKSNPAFVNGQTNSNQNNLKLYYKRDKYNLQFVLNYPENVTFTGTEHKRHSEFGETLVQYEAPLNSFDPSLVEVTPATDEAASGTNLTYYAPDHYIFVGWFEDKEGTKPFNFNSTMGVGGKIVYAKWEKEKFPVQIDPNGAEIDHINHGASDYMASIYTYEGGIRELPTDHEVFPAFRYTPGGNYRTDQATYFSNYYNEGINPYKLNPPDYIPINDVTAQTVTTYYYLNTQRSDDYDDVPADLRNALYLTEEELHDYFDFFINVVEVYKELEPEKYANFNTEIDFNAWRHRYVGAQKYGKISDLETTAQYAFREWYQVVDGQLELMPYDFETQIQGPVTLQAVWQLSGGYRVIYVPEYRVPGGMINGTMDQWTDPEILTSNYAEFAEVTVLKQPTNVTVDPPSAGSPEEYIFKGWRIVTLNASGSYEPLENDIYYQPGQIMTIQAKNASAHNIIFLQAVYERQDVAYRRPKVANLILDANPVSNEAYIANPNAALDHGIAQRLNEDISLPWTRWYGSDSIGTISTDIAHNQLVFGDMQSNAAIHLFKYATDSEFIGANGETGAGYFAHENGYFLLGFDKIKNEGDYIADFAADAAISVQRTDEVTLYAVWEPTVYLNFKNDMHTDITFSLRAADSANPLTLFVVNEATSKYDRERVDDITHITVAAGEHMQLAIPYGADQGIILEGVNTLGTGYKMIINSEYPEGMTASPHAEVKVNNGDSYAYDETLKTHPDGLTVHFTEEQNSYALILDDPTRNTGTQEFDYVNQDELPTAFLLEDKTRASIGYVFKGWARNPDAAQPDYPIPNDPAWELNLKAMADQFAASGDDLTKTLTLYAIWDVHTVPDKVYVYKQVEGPGKLDKDFEFELKLNWTYSIGNRPAQTVNATLAPAIRLHHGQYFLVEQNQYVGSANEKAYYRLNVTVFQEDGTAIGSDGTPLGENQYTAELFVEASSTGSITTNQYHVEVKEVSLGNYLDSARVLNDTTDLNQKSIRVTENTGADVISWDDPATGGSVLLTNTRKTADVIVRKSVEDPEGIDPGRNFIFEASLEDADPDYVYDLNALHYAVFGLRDREGEDTIVLSGVPVGATLRLSETEADYFTTVESDKELPDLDSDSQSFTFIVPEGGDEIKFINRLRSVNLALYSWNATNDQPFGAAEYRVSRNGSTVLNPRSDGRFYPNGGTDYIIMYNGTFDITQVWCNEPFEQIPDSIPICVTTDSSGDPLITVTDPSLSRYVRIEAPDPDDPNQVYKIYILNHEKQIAPTGVALPTKETASLVLVSFGFLLLAAFMLRSRRRETDDAFDPISGAASGDPAKKTVPEAPDINSGSEHSFAAAEWMNPNAEKEQDSFFDRKVCSLHSKGDIPFSGVPPKRSGPDADSLKCASGASDKPEPEQAKPPSCSAAAVRESTHQTGGICDSHPPEGGEQHDRL